MPSVLDRPRLTVFAGPNGSGKSTAYLRFLSAGLASGEYLNPDDIAAAIRSGDAGSKAVDLRAGREVIKRTRSLIAGRRSFVRETTLSGREIGRSMESAKVAGFRVVLFFVAVRSPKASGWRVAIRVAKGGHDIAQRDQERRFPRSFANAPVVARSADAAYFLDNTERHLRLVASVSTGTVTFFDPASAPWVGRATAGLPKAEVLKSRAEALADLRETERLSAKLEVRDTRSGYATGEPIDRGTTQYAVLGRAG